MSVAIENKDRMNLPANFTSCEKIDTVSIQSIKQKVSYWKAVSRQRKHLAKLDDRLLADIGLSREQMEIEVAKPFWK